MLAVASVSPGDRASLLPTLRLSRPRVYSCAPRRPHSTQLYQHVPETRWPIIYSPRYNITFMGLEKLHPFDAGKWGKVINFLKGREGPSGNPQLPYPRPHPQVSISPLLLGPSEFYSPLPPRAVCVWGGPFSTVVLACYVPANPAPWPVNALHPSPASAALRVAWKRS